MGARPFSVTVPVEELPPVTLVGFKVTESNAGGLIVNEAVWVPPWLPEIVAAITAATGLVVTANVAVVAPANTVILAGTVATALSLDSVTMTPDRGAAAFN